MSGNYKFSWLRPGGWSRIGVAGAVALFFATPMLWSLRVFGEGDPAFQRALVFVLSGVWFFIGSFYCVGWALKGFMVRLKEGDEGDEEAGHRSAPPARPAAPPPPRPQK
ncbi:MAG: hypothetical protein ACM31L_06045 [Actinomycetota bacterium]